MTGIQLWIVEAGAPDSANAQMGGPRGAVVYIRGVRHVLDGWGRPHPAPGRTHGYVATYNAGCRCAECRAGAAEAKRRYRRRRRPS